MPSSLPKALEQLQDLGLGGDVERGGRLVGDQQLGLVDERHRDHRPLAHPAGELVRVVVDAPLGLRMPTSPSSSIARCRRRRLGDVAVGLDRLDDLVADPVEGVKRGERVLEDHRDLVAADRRSCSSLDRRAGLRPRTALVPEIAAFGAAGEAEDRQVGDALAAAGLADDPERLARLDRERDAVDRLDDAVLGLEADPQIVDREQGSVL